MDRQEGEIREKEGDILYVEGRIECNLAVIARGDA